MVTSAQNSAAPECRTTGWTSWNVLHDSKIVRLWHSRTLSLIANAESYTYPAFRESFLELRRESRRAEFALVVALCHFEDAMEEQAADGKKEL
jgi:hypothetical protein